MQEELSYQAEWMRRRRSRWHAEGKCSMCGKEKDRSHLENCDRCIDGGTKRKRESRNRRG